MPSTVHVTVTNHHAAERDAIFYPFRDVATQFVRFESGGLQHLGYPSREGLPFADLCCEAVERSAERVVADGPPSSRQWLHNGVVVWMHVFAWMVDIFLVKLCMKNYENPSIFVKVTAKKWLAPFLSGYGVYAPRRPKIQKHSEDKT